jgi:hypothetical protein
MLVGMTMMDDDGDGGGTMADDVAEELARHGDAMTTIMSEHGVGPDDVEGDGSETD